MVKCLIRITTRVNVHLRMINHCYRDVKVRVLSLGPRMLGKALGVLPLYPALMGQQDQLRASPLPMTSPSYAVPTTALGKVMCVCLCTRSIFVLLGFTEDFFSVRCILFLLCFDEIGLGGLE